MGDQVFVWREFRSWSRLIQTRMPELFSPQMKSRLLEGKVAFDAASLDWLQDAGHKIYGQNFNARKILFAGFASIYSVVRLCHGTRAEDPASFYQSAILPSNIEKLNQRAIQLFGDSPKVMETIKSLEWYTEHNAGRIWTCLDPCECLIYDYCWKGSEYLRTIANHVGMPEKVRSLGTPTLLEFDVSVKEIGEDKVNSIAGTAI